jgi:hypothetical protein
LLRRHRHVIKDRIGKKASLGNTPDRDLHELL